MDESSCFTTGSNRYKPKTQDGLDWKEHIDRLMEQVEGFHDLKTVNEIANVVNVLWRKTEGKVKDMAKRIGDVAIFDSSSSHHFLAPGSFLSIILLLDLLNSGQSSVTSIITYRDFDLTLR
ncbi:hypothetical protein DPSP01_008139 [Paraphaeosphaeria sporulosa]